MRTPESRKLANSLREHIARHNWQVLGFTFLTFFAAAFLWGALYFGGYWMILVFTTAAGGINEAAPAEYPVMFGAIAAALLFAAWFDRLVAPGRRLPDRRPFAEIFLDIVLAVPRTTLAIWGNLSAWQRLSPEELESAADLVSRVARERQVPLHSTPLDIPDQDTREKVIFALLLLRVMDVVWRENCEPRLRISPFRPSTFRVPEPRPSPRD